MQRSPGPPNLPETVYVNANPDIWMHLGEESSQANVVLLKTVQQLRAEMTNLRSDNEWLQLEHERILRSLSNWQNQRDPDPNAKDREKTPMAQHGEENPKSSKKHREDEEGHSDNVFDQCKTKRKKSEL